jgi:hypothetical protein
VFQDVKGGNPFIRFWRQGFVLDIASAYWQLHRAAYGFDRMMRNIDAFHREIGGSHAQEFPLAAANLQQAPCTNLFTGYLQAAAVAL